MRKFPYHFVGFIYLLAILVLFAFFAFDYRFSFNYEIDTNDQYYLVWVIPTVTLILLLFSVFNNCSFTVIQIAYLTIVTIICLLILFSKNYHFGNEHFFVTASIGIVSGLFLFAGNINIALVIIFLQPIMLVYQLYIGLSQYHDAVAYEDNISLAIKGSFQNSGIFACYLVTQLPLLHHTLFSTLKHKMSALLSRVLFTVMLSPALFLIYQTQSRSAWMALAVTTGAWSLFQYRKEIKAKLAAIPGTVLACSGILLAALLTGAGYYLFALKKMSAMGRMMKLSVTWDHITDDFWWGTGLGRFSWYYPQWQANYFKTHPHPPESYFLSAGESYIIFNEPVQLLKETGLMGWLLFASALVVFFSIHSPIKYNQLFTSLKLMVISILACSFTSYPLHVNYLLLLFGLCFFTVITLGDSGTLHKPALGCLTGQLLVMPVVLLLGYTSYKGIREYGAFKNWEALKQGELTDQDRLLKEYKAIYYHLSQNGKFLTDYGSVLSEDSTSYTEATTVLERAKQLHITRLGIEQLAEIYKKQHNLDKAIALRQWLCYFLPNRFLLKKELLQLYQAKGDEAKAKQTAQAILAMPVKIPSSEVTGIKHEAKRVLDLYRDSVTVPSLERKGAAVHSPYLDKK